MERLDAVTDSSDWTFKPLRDLDALLRCSICFEYYKTAMMIPSCSHNYCSVCIRRFLMNKPHCPTCSAPVTESQMRNNRTLDDLVKQFSGDRKEFLDLVRQGSTSMKTRNGLRIAPSQLTKHSTLATSGDCALELGTPSSVHVPEPPSPSLLDEDVVFVREEGWGESRQRWSDDEVGRTPVTREVRHTPVTREVGHTPVTREVGRTPVTREVGHTPMISASFDFRREEDEFGAKFEADEGCQLREFPPTVLHAFTPKRPSTGKTSPGVDPKVSWNLETPSISSAKFPYTPETPLLARTKSESATEVSLTPLSCVKVETSTPVRKRASSGVYTPVNLAVGRGGGGETGGPSPSSSSVERVDCPACGLKVNHKFINAHLDVCLSRKKSISNMSSGHHLPKLPKLVFNIMNDKQLKKKLKEYLLSTQGTRQALISRLQEYTLYYNAQYDSLDPKTPQEIAQEVEKAERARLSKKSTSTPSSVVRRGSTEEEVEQRRKEYEHANKDQFAQLIAKAREGKKKATRKEERSLFGECSKVVDEILAVDSSHSEDEALISAEKMETTVPESPGMRIQKRRSSKQKRKANIVAQTSDSEEEEQPQGEEDPDFLPSTPFRTRKKRKRY